MTQTEATWLYKDEEVVIITAPPFATTFKEGDIVVLKRTRISGSYKAFGQYDSWWVEDCNVVPLLLKAPEWTKEVASRWS